MLVQSGLRQGITVAATEAMTLCGLLARHAGLDARRYFRAIAAAIDVPWDIDRSVPTWRSARYRASAPPRCAWFNAHMPRLHAAAAHDTTRHSRPR
jgi:hypothetical protein